MITERLKIWILLLVVAGCGTGTAWAQKMVKVSGTVYNIAENQKVPFSDVTVDVYAAKSILLPWQLVAMVVMAVTMRSSWLCSYIRIMGSSNRLVLNQ